jgi:hypothetical protein
MITSSLSPSVDSAQGWSDHSLLEQYDFCMAKSSKHNMLRHTRACFCKGCVLDQFGTSTAGPGGPTDPLRHRRLRMAGPGRMPAGSAGTVQPNRAHGPNAGRGGGASAYAPEAPPAVRPRPNRGLGDGRAEGAA